PPTLKRKRPDKRKHVLRLPEHLRSRSPLHPGVHRKPPSECLRLHWPSCTLPLTATETREPFQLPSVHAAEPQSIQPCLADQTRHDVQTCSGSCESSATTRRVRSQSTPQFQAPAPSASGTERPEPHANRPVCTLRSCAQLPAACRT